jgi:hypothetical protein
MVILHGHFTKMKITKNEVIISIFIVLILALLIYFSPKPQLSPPCGDCTPWVDIECGGSICEDLEMLQARNCTGELPEIATVPFGDDFPENSPPIQHSPPGPACIKRCVPMPETCNAPPEQPFSPFPEDLAENVSFNLTLLWNATDSNNDSLLYNLYFGINSSPEVFSENIEETNYSLYNLNNYTTYYWQIIVRDIYNETESPIWEFITRQHEEEAPINDSGEGESEGEGEGEGEGESEPLLICTENELTCSENILMICRNNRWDIVEICENICENHGCVPLEGEPLFDIKVFLDEESNEVYIGEKVKSNIVMYNFGTLKPVDVLLECALEDFEKNKLDYFDETLAVDLQTSINRELRFPEDTLEGTYILSCYLTYENETISSSELIRVFGEEGHIETPLGIIRFDILLYTAGILISIAIISILIKKIRKQKQGGKKIGNRNNRVTKTTSRKYKKDSKRYKNV